MKNLMYIKHYLVSKEAFTRENSQMGFRKFILSGFRKILSKGAKILAFDIFFRYADCQGSIENVSIVSARGKGPKMGLFSVS